MTRHHLLASLLACGSLAAHAQTIPSGSSLNITVNANSENVSGDITASGVVNAGGFDGGQGVFSALVVKTGPNQISGATTFGAVVSAPAFDGGSVAGTTGSFTSSLDVSGGLNARDGGFNNVTVNLLTTTAGSGATNIAIPTGGRLDMGGAGGGHYLEFAGGVLNSNGQAFQAVNGVVTSTQFQNQATSGTQFVCSGAGTCSIGSASGQPMVMDCGGGTCAARVGVTNATSVLIGSSTTTKPVQIAGSSGGAFVGTCAMSAGTTCTATVPSGATCVCSPASAGTAASVGNAVSSTTFTCTASVINSQTWNVICL